MEQTNKSSVTPYIISGILLAVGIIGFFICSTLQYQQKLTKLTAPTTNTVTVTNTISIGKLEDNAALLSNAFNSGAICAMKTVTKMMQNHSTAPTNAQQYLDMCYKELR